ncbi:SusC/RagA family TonB-linked outer membrane protein [Pedobacter sp. LMG 31464]|uniref:SusC/RagA family TonB-linked outer membrane protein n=1 Tax=Pedobacter planticolens TaxID=2679964 RepID=A0A923IVB3_9SPHI|nr:SusC/RagA family TonB-linked outer membrane protein [Pedobacter planticolens]MBB2143862.1 SusC/RagA family TonB-linked outer membrane protein [Pedobacter planticolens]
MKKKQPFKVFRHSLFILFLSLFAVGSLFAQNTPYVIKGVVTDGRTKLPIPGASVKISNKMIETTSNANGNYELTAKLPAGKYELVVSYLGYTQYTVDLNLGDQKNITLNASISEDLLRLNEVVVTGTSVATSRKTLGNAISTVGAKDFANSNATSIDQALSGKIAGAQISQNSGNPAGGISVRLRGTSTVVGAADPLYIIDGVIVNNSSTELLDLGGYAQNRLVDINPADIDHMEIIKGAAAAAIYGSRASNGVVQIFTKKGKEGKPSYSFSTNVKISDVRKTLDVNTYPFRYNNTTVTDLSKTAVQRYDYQDDIFRSAVGTENNLSVSGGSNGTQYFVSGNYLFNQGIIDQSDFSRAGARARVDQRLNDWLKISAGMNYVLSSSHEIPNGGLNEAYGALTGFIFSNNFINPAADPATGIYPSTSPTAVQRTNPLEAINRFQFAQRTSRFIGNFQATATPIKGLSINYVLGYDNSTQIGTGYIPVGNTTPSYNTGFSKRADKTSFLVNNDINVSYQTKLADWLQSTTGIGGTAQSEKIYQTGITATQLGLIGQTINNGVSIPSEFRSEINVMGAFIQQTFGIKEKIYLTGAARYDVSSVFGATNRGQFYPKVSASYILSNEKFWSGKLANVISSVKLRASYGQAGNLTAIGAYDRYSSYIPVNSAGLPSVYSPALLGNIGIKPERQEEIEVGTDLSFFKDRLGVEFSYYKKDVKDLLLLANLTPSTGYSSQYINVGTMTNRGFELMVRGVPVLTDKVKWDVVATYSRNKNVVNNIPGGVLTFAGGFGQVAAVNGSPLGAFYATYFARNADGSLLLTAGGLPQTEKAGRTGGQPSGATLKKVIGDPNPDWVGSLINEVSVGKHFSFRAQLDASIGGDVFNFTKRVGDRDLYGGLKGYEPELRGEVPKGTSAALFSIFENWIEDGSFVKLREVSASYSFKPRFLKSGNMRFSLAGRNLFSIDNYSGYDPEINAAGQSSAVRGFDFVEVPIPRQIVLGFNFTF